MLKVIILRPDLSQLPTEILGSSDTGYPQAQDFYRPALLFFIASAAGGLLLLAFVHGTKRNDAMLFALCYFVKIILRVIVKLPASIRYK